MLEIVQDQTLNKNTNNKTITIKQNAQLKYKYKKINLQNHMHSWKRPIYDKNSVLIISV